MTVLWTVGLFSQPFLSLSSGPMTIVAMMGQMGVLHGVDNMDFYSIGPTGYHCAEYQIWYCFLGNQQAAW